MYELLVSPPKASFGGGKDDRVNIPPPQKSKIIHFMTFTSQKNNLIMWISLKDRGGLALVTRLEQQSLLKAKSNPLNQL